MGGEKWHDFVSSNTRLGSPPHGRGKDMDTLCTVHDARITPAWAGKSCRVTSGVMQGTDHPRMGGEKKGSSAMTNEQYGSPPHGRGKGPGSAGACARPGITPAWAGKRAAAGSLRSALWDHPRVGGEKAPNTPQLTARPGSPPRGRGKGTEHPTVDGAARITPAWAGKSWLPRVLYFSHEDHPRVGGEKKKTVLTRSIFTGSPPRGRGKVKRSHRSGIFISGPIPFHSVLHRPAGSGGSRAGRDGSPAGQPQNAGPA